MNNQYNLIIADDHQIVIDGIKSILKNTPFKIVKECTNGQEAWDSIHNEQESYDLLLTDISMPLLSGTDLCKMVKHSHPEIKVLILSMYNSAAVVQEALIAEADGFILKSTGKEELQKALYQILNDGTYFSNQIIPLLYTQMQKEEEQKQLTGLLSAREIEVLELILKEHTSEEIAEKLFISKKTVDHHRANLLTKTNSKTTIGLVKFALRMGILSENGQH